MNKPTTSPRLPLREKSDRESGSALEDSPDDGAEGTPARSVGSADAQASAQCQTSHARNGRQTS